jgi:hypothetical protein
MGFLVLVSVGGRPRHLLLFLLLLVIIFILTVIMDSCHY